MQLNKLYRPWAVEDGQWGIEIIEGKYAGTVIQIEKVDFDEKQDGNMLVDYHNIHTPKEILKEEYDSPQFVDTMQLIFSDIIARAIEEYKETNGN
jgi:hypothetical protein